MGEDDSHVRYFERQGCFEIAAIQGYKPGKIMCSYIAYSGNLPMMKWARSDKLPRKDDAAEEQSMKQIRLTPFPWSKTACRHAASFGHLKLLKWLHEQGCPWDFRTFISAAQFGNIEMMEWLYQKKCPWNELTFSSAARSGNLDILKWLHERNCPWEEQTFEVAYWQS